MSNFDITLNNQNLDDAKEEIIKLRELASKVFGTEWDFLQKHKRT